MYIGSVHLCIYSMTRITVHATVTASSCSHTSRFSLDQATLRNLMIQSGILLITYKNACIHHTYFITDLLLHFSLHALTIAQLRQIAFRKLFRTTALKHVRTCDSSYFIHTSLHSAVALAVVMREGQFKYGSSFLATIRFTQFTEVMNVKLRFVECG